MHANVLPFYTSLTPVRGQKVKKIFSEEGYGAHHIMQLKKFGIMHTPGLLGWVSCLIGFGNDLSDTQDELKCWRMGFIFCGKHLPLLTMIQVSDRVM